MEGDGSKSDGDGNKEGEGKGGKRDGNGNKEGKVKGGKRDGNGNKGGRQQRGQCVCVEATWFQGVLCCKACDSNR
jgi:hypothetical protein